MRKQIFQDTKFYFNRTERLILYFYALKFNAKKITLTYKVVKNKLFALLKKKKYN